MKFVPFRRDGKVKSRDLFISALENAPVESRGIDFGEINRRMRVLDAIEAAGENADGVSLEDSDWGALSDALRGVRYNQVTHSAMRDLIAIRDDVANATAPEKLAQAGNVGLSVGVDAQGTKIQVDGRPLSA